jgi:phosphotransferase system HPr (HPr) family protein
VSGEAPALTRRRVTVVNAKGIHARPAAMLASRAKGFVCSLALVMLEAPGGEGAEPGTRVDAKDVLDIMFLGAPAGSVLEVEGDGPDSEVAVAALARLIGEGFQE